MPDWRSTVRSRLEAVRLDPAREIDVIEELAQHLEDRYEALKSAGVDDAEAERETLAELSEAKSFVEELERSDRRLGQAGARAETTPGAPVSGGGLRSLWSDLR